MKLYPILSRSIKKISLKIFRFYFIPSSYKTRTQAFGLDGRGCIKKAYFTTEYILVNECWTLFKRGAIEFSVWIEEDIKKLTFQQNIFWSTKLMLNTFKQRCYRAFSLDRRGCKKSLLYNRIYFGQQMLNTYWERCYRAFSLDRTWCKKSSLLNRIYFGQQMLNTFKKVL